MGDSRTLYFPSGNSIGYLHGRSTGYPYDFHGRLKKEGGQLEDSENPGWWIVGEAWGAITVDSENTVLLEMLPQAARDLSVLRNIEPGGLNALWLGNTHVDDEGLVYLSHLAGLEWIDIQNNDAITDRGMGHLKNLNGLRHIGIHWTRVSDAGLDIMADMSSLEYLDVWGCPVSPEGLLRFKKCHPDCRIRTE